jgi:hypothetical protein
MADIEELKLRQLQARQKRAQEASSGEYDHSAEMKRRAEAAKAGRLKASEESLVRAEEMNRKAEAAMTLSQYPGVAGPMAKAVQGIPFVGEWIDEGFDKINPGQGERLRQLQGAYEEQHPVAATAAEVTGGIVGSVPLALGGLGIAGNAATRTGAALRGAGLGAVGGATEGAVAGAGRSEPGQRLEGAKAGGAIGLGLGAALGGIAPLVGEGVEALARRVKKLDVRTIANEFGLSGPTARTVKEALVNDDLDAAVARLGQLGDDAMLADSGPATGQLLNASSATGGKALRVTREAVEDRSQQIGQRLPGKLDDILGKPKGVKTAAREIAESTQLARSAAYDTAYDQAIDYSAAGRQIEDVLDRVPSKTMMGAISEANDAMREAGTRNLQIMAEIGDDGSVIFREMPNVQQLDKIKQALDTIGREAVDQFGRPTAQGNRARRLARDLRDAISNAVPEYKRALRVGGDKIQQDEALDIGRKLLFKGTSVEDVKDFVSGGISDEARSAARQGVRETIENTLSNVRRTITDPDIDAREAMQLVKEVSSRANKSKLRLILGAEKADALLDELDRAATALTLRAAVARNSDTAIRQSIQGQVQAETTPGLIRRTVGNMGNPLEAAREISQTIAGVDPRTLSGEQKAIFDEIATALTQIRGPEAQRALAVVRRAMNGQPIKDEQAKLIGRLVAGAGAASSYQGASQSLAPR